MPKNFFFTASIPRFYFYKKIKPPILILHIRKEKRRKNANIGGGKGGNPLIYWVEGSSLVSTMHLV